MDSVLQENNKKEIIYWTAKDTNFLIEKAGEMSNEEIAFHLNKSVGAIANKKTKLKIRSKCIKWTAEKDFYLETKWGEISINRIASHLGTTVNAVKSRAVRIGLGNFYDDSYLKIADVARILNVDSCVIRNWINKYGLPFKKSRCTTRNIKLIDHSDLMEFLKNNQNKWNAAKVKINDLGLEDEWLISKRKNDLKNIKLNNLYSPWTPSLEKKLLEYRKQGKSYKYISEKMNKSEFSLKSKYAKLQKK